MIDEAKRASSMKSLPEQQERLLEAAGGHLEAGKYEILVHLDSSSIMSKIIFKIGQMATRAAAGGPSGGESKPIKMAASQQPPWAGKFWSETTAVCVLFKSQH